MPSIYTHFECQSTDIYQMPSIWHYEEVSHQMETMVLDEDARQGGRVKNGVRFSFTSNH